jgi:FSR family fosmidomycin resistance protein-like MFS transporter
LSFVWIALGHLAVDILSGLVPVLLAVLSTPLGLTNALIGLVSAVYSLAGALPQPAFGWLADRFGTKWTTAAGVLWMAVLFTLVPWLPGRWVLAVLILAGFGSAAFHPSGASKASEDGNRFLPGGAATATALFFLFGQAGGAVGPALGGLLVDHLGLMGVLALTSLALLVGVAVASPSASRRDQRPERHPFPDAEKASAPRARNLTAFLLIVSLATLRFWAQSSTQTFTPLLYKDLGYTPTSYGSIAAMFMVGVVAGGVLGGVLGDRWGNRRTVVLSFALGVIPFYLFPAARGISLLVLIALAGVFNGAPNSILVTMAQRELPGRAGLASGMTLGLMFALGAVGVYFSGLLADKIGLAPVLQANALLTLGALLVSALAYRREARRLISTVIRARFRHST